MSKSTIRTIIIAFVLIIAAGGGLALMVSQTSQQAIILEQQLVTLQEQRAQEVAFQRLERIAEESEEDRILLGSYFLSRESESIDFLNLVEQLAPEAGVTLSVSNLNNVEESSGSYEWIGVTFTFVGERSRVDAFLQVLENLPYLSRVTDVSLNARSSEDWQAEVKMQVMIYAYDT